MNCNTINQLLSKADRSTGIDFEGDDTYRVHVKTTKSLIQEAYDLGKRHGRREMLCEQSKATRNIECKS